MHNVNKLEAIVDSIGKLNGCFHNPDSDAYRLRSPLLVRSFACAGKHEVDEQGRRVFDSILAGYTAAMFDVRLKLEGNSRAGLKPTDTLSNLLRVYGITEPGGISAIVSFLRRALKNDQLSKDTPLAFFLKEEDGTQS